MADIITLPPAAFPKPGEEVVWFSQNRQIEGTLLGYDIHEKPIIINQFKVPDGTASFNTIRAKDPNKRIDPNWLRLPRGGLITDAEKELADAIASKLHERIPPGPSYMELITEMYLRGYETYLVGGTVRDFIQGEKSKDIDLVTTMPLKSALPLIKSMFNNKYSYYKENGYIRIGGAPASGDPFIDVKNFTVSNSGAGSKIFGSEIESDLKIRDFACNAIYYDAINRRIIDPSGRGIKDAKNKKLTIVKDQQFHSAYFSGGQIVIRLVKFVTRGYGFDEETYKTIKSEFCPLLSTMEGSRRMTYINAQVLNKVSPGDKKETYSLFVEKMNEIGLNDEYEQLIKPFESLLGL